MSGRKRRKFDASDDDTEDSDYDASPRKKSKATKLKAMKLPRKAEIVIRATDTSPDEAATQDRLKQIDTAVLEKIKKALALGHHEGTGEDEARRALRMATKLLDRHNVTQADIMSQESDEEKLKRAGTSIVSVKSTANPPVSVKAEEWVKKLAWATNVFFDCQHYWTVFGSRVDWCFYGLAEQTVTAAHAFEMTYNLVLSWSMKPSIGTGVHRKNCYRVGVAHGLRKMASQEKEQEKKQTIHREQALLQSRRDAEQAEELARIERLKDPACPSEACAPPSKMEDSSSEDITVISERTGCRVKIEEVEDEDMVPRFNGFVDKEEIALLDLDSSDTAALPAGRDIPLNPACERSSHDDHVDFSDSELSELSEVPDSFLFADLTHHDNESDDGSDIDALISQPPPATMVSQKSIPPLAEQYTENTADKDNNVDEQWSSVGQLIAFRDTSKAIGDAYLVSQGLKIKKRYSGTLRFKDKAAKELYYKGKEDAKRINVRRKLLKGKECD